MESDVGSWEQNAVMSELVEGLEIARNLKQELLMLTSPSSVRVDSLLQRILSSYDKALLLLRWNESVPMQQPHSKAASAPIKHNSNKRKMMPKWTEQIRVKIENGVEGSPHEDGYSWRKYGQKDILSAKYPRSYYRCTFRKTKGCVATKQVQRSEEDLTGTIFEITYRGTHTCNSKGNDAVPPPQLQDKTDHHGHALENDPFSQTSFFSEPNYFGSPSFHAAGIASTTNSPIFDFNFSLDAVGIDANFPFNASAF